MISGQLRFGIMTAPPARPDLQAVLEDRGYRMTGPRRAVADLLDRKEEGFTAEQVCGELTGVGRATVYRTLRLLLEAGAVCKLSLSDGVTMYSLARAEHHHHAVCIRCGSVTEFRDATAERLLRTLGEGIAGTIVGHRMEFYVVCRSCAESAGQLSGIPDSSAEPE